MATLTFSHTIHTSPSSHGLHGLREFLAAWFRATPAYLVYQVLTHRG